MTGKRNRQAGHKFELDVRNMLIEAGYPHVVSSRSASRLRDAQKIDLVNADEFTQGRLPFNIQCKNTCGGVNYHKLLDELPKDGQMNVIAHNRTVKTAGGKFVTKGQYAILPLEAFIKLINKTDA